MAAECNGVHPLAFRGRGIGTGLQPSSNDGMVFLAGVPARQGMVVR